MLILVTNDDGADSPGLHALVAEMKKLGRVFAVAPAQVKSAVSHSITLHRPLRVREMRHGGLDVHVVDGTPADCVKLALHRLLGRRPDMVVSGINMGLNTGQNVLYSGTVAGALEAGMHGVTSCAVSLEMTERTDVPTAARLARPIIQRLIEKYPSTSTTFNINIPALPADRVRGVVVCGHDTNAHRDRYRAGRDPRGQPYYWLEPLRVRPNGRAGKMSDAVAVSRGYISLSPLKRDLTQREALDGLSGLFPPR
jgi:5'-nucleotidase